MRYKIFSILFLLFFMAGSVLAQKKGGGKGNMTPEQKAQKHTDKMAEVMGLSADVKAKVLGVNLERAKALAPIHKAVAAKYPDKAVRKASKAAIKTEFGPQKKTITTAHTAALKAAGVTDAQLAKWKASKKGGGGKGKKTATDDDDDDDDDDN